MTPKRLRVLVPALILALTLSSSLASAPVRARSFYMGFTDWPYDATVEAIAWVNREINQHGDIVSAHIEEGVPWEEAGSGKPWPKEFLEDLKKRMERRVPGKKLELEISPINQGRSAIAENRGAGRNEPTPAPWKSLALDRPQVKTAYLNYSDQMIRTLKPDYVVLGVEVNLLIRNSPALWPSYVRLHQHVFRELKKRYPALPLGVSVACQPYFPEWSPDNLKAQLEGLRDLLPSVDFLGFSVHPFASGLLAGPFPDDYLEKLFALAGKKPIAVTESSYPAQEWSMTVNGTKTTWTGTNEKQLHFLEKLVDASLRHQALFLLWFTIRDYDALWKGLLREDTTALVWRDTGLYDEKGLARPSLAYWDSVLLRKRSPSSRY